jgi:murein DD-endopeptidase MepM/ murein hydrolase activator NlpD
VSLNQDKNSKFKNKFLKKLLEYHTVVFISKKTGKTHIFKIPSFFPPLIIFFGSAIITIAIAMSIGFYITNQSARELEYIRDESLGLQSEVEALNNKIRNIQETMNQVKYYSDKIKKVTTRTDDRKHGKNHKETSNNSNMNSSENGIGPLTKDEYELSNKITTLKHENLELKSLFEITQDSEIKTSKQLNDLKKFLVEAQKAALKLQNIPDIAPVRGRLTSTFGWRPSPFGGKGRIHFGLDIAARHGSPIFATANGVVYRVTQTDDYGKFIEIIHEKKMITRYAHTSEIYVKVGSKVKKGDIIAAVGNTGHSTGPHVHYEIEMSGKKFDPETFIVLW